MTLFDETGMCQKKQPELFHVRDDFHLEENESLNFHSTSVERDHQISKVNGIFKIFKIEANLVICDPFYLRFRV
jgi:hypothetical protein